MILEFMGCTGAGKSTIACGVVRQLADHGYQVQGHVVVGSSSLASLANALYTPALLPRVLGQCREYRSALLVTWTCLRRRAPGRFWQFARFWAAVRLLGQHARRVRGQRSGVCVVDEGVAETVHLAFSGPPPASEWEIERLASALPLPDLLVWVDAPVPDLLHRTLTRPDPPRELRGRPPGDVQLTLETVRDAFCRFVEIPRIRDRVIRVWNPAAHHGTPGAAAERVAEALRERLRP